MYLSIAKISSRFLSTTRSVIFTSVLLSPLVYAAGPAVFELAPGIVVDRQGSVIFAMHEGKSVQALDLSNGEQIWNSDAAEKPLWLAGGILYTQGFSQPASGNFQVFYLNPADGSAGMERFEIDLPMGVEPMIDQKAGKTFNIRMRGENQSLSVSWRYIDQSALRREWPDVPPGKVITEKGAALLDATNGEVEKVSPDQVTQRAWGNCSRKSWARR